MRGAYSIEGSLCRYIVAGARFVLEMVSGGGDDDDESFVSHTVGCDAEVILAVRST
jgi:hypothetical protein